MANQIQIRRSSGSNSPVAGSLEKGELAWVDHGTGGGAGCLYIGDMTSAGAVVRKIGGTDSSDFITDILNNTVLTGAPTATTVSADDNSTKLATTAYVDRQVLSGTNAISSASDTNISAPAGGHVLIYDGTDSWDNKALSGDVSIATDGTVSVNTVQANSVALGTDTTGSYISTITGTSNEIAVSANGVESAAVTIGLTNNVTISGNLTVTGTTTTVDSTTVSVADPIFVIGENGTDDNKDRGIEFKYNDGAAKTGWFGYDDSDSKFKYIADATNTSEVFSGSLGNVAFGEIDGTLTTASQTNITGLGTITTGTWNADIVSSTFGGLGIDTSSSTGVGTVSGGTWSVQSEMPVTLGGTGLQAVASNGILVGAGTADMTVLTAGSAGQKLAIDSNGAPAWTDVMDGGTF
jgi:hypothetical protein